MEIRFSRTKPLVVLVRNRELENDWRTILSRAQNVRFIRKPEDLRGIEICGYITDIPEAVPMLESRMRGIIC